MLLASLALLIVSSFAQAGSFTPVDPRELIPAYAKSHKLDPRNLFAATGQIVCPNKAQEGGFNVGTAHVTVINSVVVTVQHEFCLAKADPKECHFTTWIDGKAQSFNVASGELSRECGDDYVATFEVDKDWAVLTLEKPVPKITPYEVDITLPKTLREGVAVTFVANQSEDFCLKDKKGNCVLNAKKKFFYPKYAVDCQVHDISRQSEGFSDLYYSDCPGGHGSSGGAILVGPPEHRILAAIGSRFLLEPQEEQKWEAKNGKPVSHPYRNSLDPDRDWKAQSRAVSGRFAETIMLTVYKELKKSHYKGLTKPTSK